MKQKLFIITGATASGKSNVALHIAKNSNNTEIISADSMQVYRKMDIGTAKVSREVRDLIKHHLIDIVDPWESFNLGKYVKEAQDVITKTTRTDKQIIVVGGTGLYIKGLTHGVFTGPEADWQLRDQLQKMIEEKGEEHIFHKLQEVDPVSATKFHPKDHKRVIRALEVYEKTGTTISTLQKQFANQTPEYDYTIFIINRQKEDLHKRIDKRVEDMFNFGFVDEVKKLKNDDKGLGKQAQQALGYKEILQYLNEELDLSQVKELIKHNTKRFAKRQLTWFRSFDSAHWVNQSPEDNYETLGDKILKEIKNIL